MPEIKLTAQPRTQFGKGAARKLRREHQIPAVIYGHGTDPIHVALPGHATMMALKTTNAVLTVDLDGKETLVLAKDVQRDPIKPIIEHVDLVVVRRGEKVNVEVAVHVEGEAAPDTLVNLDLQSLELAVDAMHIPERVVVSVEGYPAGSQVLAGAVELPEGAELLTDPEWLVVNVTAQAAAEELEAEGAEAEGAEGEAAAAEAVSAADAGEG
ncbi:MAG: 50S ribosomal protein L25/general stress protein Ctc [Intrasporangium sp.]|uniref:50S ribosomal protein L25/general stress protein Ctc n=1 Tax=Intrasporangium sp. TaxID=1925024 RepID=UPI0026483ABE|nr:50S ribosomal protein L25/general stress protein Ctc [Intrasporangium sp.]MDN5796762.1 50S ribosomal protein L25/general stress protein Ctc [Intrasporangium sp.]